MLLILVSLTAAYLVAKLKLDNKRRDLSKPLRVAILGGSGIGRVHARLFDQLGAAVVAVLCTSDANTSEVTADLLGTFGIVAKPFSEIHRILEEDLDAVSVCTPPALHFEHIMSAFDNNIPVFCEKPLFWNKSYGSNEVIEKLKVLQNHPNRRLFVNTCNTVFIDTINKGIGTVDSPKNFIFEFYTNGSSQGIDIAVDLFPHGFSLLLHIFGKRKISKLNWTVGQNNFFCEFMYGGCNVSFDFREDINGPRHLLIGLDSKRFRRMQEGRGVSYKVHLMDEDTNERIPSIDPFEVYISEFIDYCSRQGKHLPDGFNTASLNMKLMASCFDLINQTST